MSEKRSIIDEIAENLVAIFPIVAKTYTKAVRSKTEFTPATLFTLGALFHHGKLTMTGIGNHLMVPKPHVTVLVDKLISDELVERLYDESDRRIIYIQLTEKGREIFLATKKIIGKEFRDRLEQLDQGAKERLLDSSANVKEVLVEIMKDIYVQNNNCVKNQ